MTHIPNERGGQVVAFGGRAAWPRDARASPAHLHLESAYLPTALPLSCDAPCAHSLALLASGGLEREALRACLLADPNVCDIDPSGARIPCTHLAPRVHRVALTRLRAGEGSCRRFAITGADLLDGLTLVVSRYGERFHLELGDAVVMLHPREHVRRAASGPSCPPPPPPTG